MSGVDVRGIAKSFDGTPVLAGIDADFPSGTFTSLLGPSGSGKTTLLRIIAGFIRADAGRVSIDGRDVTEVPVWARNIGMVFQSYALFPHMTVAGNIAFGLARRGIRGAAAQEEVSRALALVRLEGFAKRRPRELSGGQQQRVALARAVVTRPSVLLLDEPLSALDRRLRQEMQVELLRIQRESGLTTIFVTHDQEEALTLSDRVAILDRGRIVQMGPPAEVYERPRTRFSAAFLGDVNLLEGVARGGALVLPGGRAVVPAAPLGRPDGAAATLALRPERLAVEPADGAGPAAAGAAGGRVVLPGRVLSALYQGAALLYEVEAEGMTFKVFAQNRDGRPFRAGDAVRLSFAPADAVPLGEEA